MHGPICILERRAQLRALASQHPSEVDERPRHGQVVVSLPRGASTYAYGQFPWYTASKPTIGDSPLTLLSHMPTIRESVPSDHRTKRCRRGSEPIVYGSRPCNFAAEGKVAESEGYRVLGLKTRVRFSLKAFRRFSSYHLNSPKISQLKCHPSTHKNNIRNGLSTKPASPVNRRLWRLINEDP